MKLKSPSGHKIMLIANPMAGNRHLKKKWDAEIYPFLKRKLINFDFEFTKRKSHATQITRDALKNGYNLIVSMGGDGTINEVVNGFFKNHRQINPKAALGILPFGSGGDFIRTLKFDRDYKKTVKHLVSKKTMKIDVGLVDYKSKKYEPRYFINIADVGLVASIMNRVNVKNKGIPAFLRYFTGSFQGFVDYKNTKVRLHIHPQGSFVVNLTNLTVANGQFFGRGMRPAPQAKLDDGILDVILLKNMNLPRFILHFPQLYTKKKLISSKVMDHFQADKIKIEVLEKNRKLSTEVDGETYGAGNQTIRILPGALNLKI